MTKSQRVKLNEILHREPIGYASSFDMIEIEPVELEHVEHAEHAEEQEQKHILFEKGFFQNPRIATQSYESNFVCQKQNNGCCIIM